MAKGFIWSGRQYMRSDTTPIPFGLVRLATLLAVTVKVRSENAEGLPASRPEGLFWVP